MKNKKLLSVLLLGVFAFLPLCLVGCDKSDQKLSSYSIVCQYDDEKHVLNCEQEVCYVNSSDNALKVVEFFLYANSFKECAVPNSHIDIAYPNGVSYGGIEVGEVLVSGSEANFSLKNEAILVVELAGDLYPDESANIQIKYVVTLANINSRLGYGENTVNFGNFFPIACVYDGGFVENDFAKNGDPFYSDIANFDVEISYNSDFILACSGNIYENSENDNVATTKVKGEMLRDFCFVLSRNFRVLSQDAGGVKVNYFYVNDENCEANLEVASRAVSDFCEMFGQYPYKTLNVVQADFCFGGMEYPNLVYVANHISDLSTYQYVIVHEIAHQWWYSVVGNDEYREAWVDESLTEYSAMLFYERHGEYGQDYQNLIKNAKTSYLMFVEVYKKIQGQVDESMNRALCDFVTEPEYVNCVYVKGVLMYDSIRETVGDAKFFKCLKGYFEDFSFKNAKGGDLIKSFSKSAKINLEGYFGAWIDGTVVITG